MMRRNRNRGYQQLRVWVDAVELYRIASSVFRSFPYELKRVASQNIASVDSVHRNIAEGYCRRSIKEYLQHLYVALGSLGESVSGFQACHLAGQISTEEFERLDSLAFKLENALLRLVETLEQKRDTGEWTDSLVIREGNAAYSLTPRGDEPADLSP
jgi:four helix bundle protein